MKNNQNTSIKIHYSGNLDNHESKRPELSMRCTLTKDGSTIYKLVNILVNGGKYDTYVVENLETKKRKKARNIYRVRKSQTRPFTKEEVLGMVFSQTSGPALVFQELIRRVEENPLDMEAWKKLVKLALCDNHTAKTEDIVSLDSSCIITCADNEMRDNPLFICNKCFSDAQQAFQPSTREKLIRNAYLLCFYDIPAEAFPILNLAWFRFECFGDVMNDQQQRNYLKLVCKNPHVTFAQWTKKPWILNHTFKAVEKPQNLIVILSAPIINKRLSIQEARRAWWFVDKTFTVYTKEYAKAHNVVITCGGARCIGCWNCYRLTGPEEVAEIKK